MKRWVGVIGLVCMMFVFTSGAPEATEAIDPEKLIRLHVLANSDSEEDQALKYKVKDSIVNYMKPKFAQSKSLEQSRGILLAEMENIQVVAKEALEKNGSDQTVRIEYGEYSFPTKYYGSFSLPAGEYEAVRVLLGDGVGANWWCVLFPPICFVDQQGDSSSSYVSEQQPEAEIKLSLRVLNVFDRVETQIAQFIKR